MSTKISRNQEQFWLLQKIYQNNSAYNISSVFRLKGNLNIPALEKAVNTIIRKHEALRFYVLEDETQVLSNCMDCSAYYKIEVESIDSNKSEDDLHQRLALEINASFTLTEWPLFRIKLFYFHEEYLLSLVFHHILIDLHSKEIFANELSDYYSIFTKDFNAEINFLSDCYTDYSHLQQNWLTTEEANKMRNSYKQDIAAATGSLEIATDFPRPKTNTLSGQRSTLEFDNKLTNGINDLAQQWNVNSFTILLSAYAAFLFRLSNQTSVTIGVPLTNRRDPAFKDVFGCFVNIVPIFLELQSNDTPESLVRKVRKQLLIAHRRQEIPFLDVYEMYRNYHKSNNLFQAGFAFEPPIHLDLDNIEVSTEIVKREGSQLDLFLTFWEQAGVISGFLEYSSQLFHEQTIERFKQIFLKVLHSFLEKSPVTIENMDILPNSDSESLIEWNTTEAAYSEHKCLHHKFEEQVDKSAHAIALTYKNQHLTYIEVEKHANRLAHYLISQNVSVENSVCVCQERSFELVISILAILKAGATYVPVDPEFPAERLNMILEDAEPRFILTTKSCDRNIPPHFPKIYVDDLLITPFSQNDSRPNVEVNSHHLAYIVYTSGSTGKPKGVMIEHHSVINKLEWMQYQHPIEKSDVLMLKTPVTFDVSMWELFWWFFNGASLAILPPKCEKDPETIISEVEQKQVSTIIFVPSMFSSFVNYVKAHDAVLRLKTLKYIIQIGEILSPELVNNFNHLRNSKFDPLLVNTYGPAEATIAVTYFNCPKETDTKAIYIGKPIFNTKIVILNKRNRIQPIGVPGELAILGVNLSRGYVKRPELNLEKFVEVKYPDGNTFRAYKTGDIARWLDNGNLDFIGRADNQVKIRGYRIETGDIESVLLKCDFVKTAAVIADKSNPENIFLVGYVTLKKEGMGTADQIKHFLHSQLPDYMVPAHMMILDQMPLNSSEKIDRKALPKPVFNMDSYVAPTVNYEPELSHIWKKVLNLQKVGISNNFFDLGGNSLLAINVASEIKVQLNKFIEPVKLMEYPTIKDLSDFLIGNDSTEPVKDLDSKARRRQDFLSLKEKRSRS